MFISDGYKYTELGIIPSDWKITPLKEFAKVVTGKTPPTKDSNYWNGKIPWFTPSDIGGKRDLFTSERKLSEKGYESNSAKLPPESVLVTCIASIGKNAITGVWSSCNQQINAILPNDNFNSNYLYYWISNNTPYYETNAAKTAVTIINKATFESLPVVLPPLPEQRKIAEILTTVDDHISETEALIEKTKILKQGLMQQLLTKGIGHTEFKDTEIGRIPVEWKVVELQHMFSRVRTKNTVGNTNVLSISAELGLVSQLEYFNNIYASKNTSNYFLLEKADFAYNKSYSSGYPMGVIKPLEKYESGIVSPLYICMRPKPDIISNTFYKYYFDSDKLVKAISPIAKEGARNHGLLNVAVPDFFSMPVALPPLSEQRQIAAILTSVDDQIDTYQAKLTSLTRLKTGLMQQLLTGKIRVKV